MNESLKLQFPVFLWQDGYIYLATTSLELCAHPRSMFDQTVQTARSKSVHLLDARGRQFEVSDWIRIRPFGGIKMFGLLLLGSVFAMPKLECETELTLSEFKAKVIGAVGSRYQYGSDKTRSEEIIARIQHAGSFTEVLAALRP